MSLFKPKQKPGTVRVIAARPYHSEPIVQTAGIVEEGPSIPAGMWEKCVSCGEILYADDLQSNLKVCPKCGYHFRLTARQRVMITADEGSFEEFAGNICGKNPLDFPTYDEKLRTARAFTGQNDAIMTGAAKIGGHECILCAMDSQFMMGSMGAVVGEKMALAAEKAIEKQLPLVVFTVSGGARMQEGMVSLMQMAKVSAVIGKLQEAKQLYVVVLTDPTTGGVTASFAMLGDITLSEPNALVGFAGRRVIEQTVRQTLPKEFQRSEFLQEKGFIDHIVHRKEMVNTIKTILALHERKPS